MTELAKKIILEANENIKAAVECFNMLFNEMHFDQNLVTNAQLAFGELIKCIKHVALIQGDITGKELMPVESLEKLAMHPVTEEEQTH